MWLVVRLIACTGSVPLGTDGANTGLSDLQVVDRALESGYLDTWFGHMQRGRGTTVVDVDLDGDPDIVAANPGDISYVVVNETVPGGPLRFRPGQVLDDNGECYWTVGAGDFDNDADQDLFVGYGGNETNGYDVVFEHTGDPEAPYVDVTDHARVMTVDAEGQPNKHATAGALVLDFDNDGLLDVFASTRLKLNELENLRPGDLDGLNPLWLNRGDLVFEDVGPRMGLITQMSTRNSQFLDIENDGDLDLFEDNFDGGSVLWANQLVETGTPSFKDVTQEFSLGGGDLSLPSQSAAMASSATDLNNDGWEDLIVFRRGPPKTAGEPDVMSPGHLIWINVEGRGFVEVASHTDINDSFLWRDHDAGVMGCQVADWNADGFPDIFVGNGSPSTGEASRLYLSSMRTEVEIDGVGTVSVPQFVNATSMIDFPADLGDFDGPVPIYPYRTHGSVAADFDGDGDLELAQHNGGAFHLGGLDLAQVQEPDRLWDFVFPEPRPGWLHIDLVGDGRFVNRDAIGAKVRLTIEQADGAELVLYQVRRSQTGFAAQNQAGVHFGLGRAVAIVDLEVTWPDGTVDSVPVPELNQRIVVER